MKCTRFYSWFPTASPYGVVMPQLQMGSVVSMNMTPGAAADQMATAIVKLPEPHRVMVVNRADALVFGNPDDLLPGNAMSLWHPAGVAAAADWWLRFLKRLAELVILNFVAFDGEEGPTEWSPAFNAAALMADPRYAEAIRLYGVPADPTTDVMQFNRGAAKMAAREVSVMDQALVRYHPRAGWSNFGRSPVTATDAMTLREGNGHAALYDPDGAMYYSPVWYGGTGQIRRTPTGKMTSMDLGDGGVPLNSWQATVWTINSGYAALRADPSGRLRIWTSSIAWANPINAGHLVELRIAALLLSGGPLLHWAGDGLTPEQYAADDEAMTAACDAYTQLIGDAAWVAPVGVNQLRSDTGYYAVTAARYSDNSIRGRVIWAVKTPNKFTANVWVDKTLTVRVTRRDGEVGTSFASHTV